MLEHTLVRHFYGDAKTIDFRAVLKIGIQARAL